MLKNFLYAALPLYAAVSLTSCENKDSFKKSPDGLEYKIVIDSAGKTVEEGGVAVLNLSFKNEKDSLNTFKKGAPISIMAHKTFKGSLEDGLQLLSAGDSAVFRISNDSLYTKMFSDSLPKEIKPGTFTDFYVKVIKVYSKEEVKKEQDKYVEQQRMMVRQQIEMMQKYIKDLVDTSGPQMKIDEGQIKEYVKQHNLTAERTENGVYYAITEKGSAAPAAPGDTVAVHYVGKLLDGTGFDSSTVEKPLHFILGTGRVIPGWEDALTKLGKGDKATIIIPSSLAYRKEGIKNPATNSYVIPPDAPLLFNIQVVDVKK